MSPSDLPHSAFDPQPHSYRGRFAPSPTGALHFGSLVAALGSYLQAKRAHGKWLVRIEDIDPPRVVPGSADLILRTLDRYGFEWDEPVLYQSTRSAAYEHALQQLSDSGLCYPCSCTRSELQALVNQHAVAGEELPYPGTCRASPQRAHGPYSWRFRVPNEPVEFHDLLQGRHCVELSQSIGDFVIKRRDGWFAYQLAVVVDDASQGITEVVRGTDLLFNTPRQIALQSALGLATPSYLHLPLVTDAAGAKLSKSSAAPAVTHERAVPVLWQALQFLQQRPPLALKSAALPELWCWALQHWQPLQLTDIRAASAPRE